MTEPTTPETEEPTLLPRQREYAAIAEKHWRTYLPSDWAAIPEAEREEFFLDQGRLVAEAVQYLAEGNADASSPGTPEEPQARARREEMALVRAEREALDELVFELTPEPGTEGREVPPSPALLE